jgi:hypothetical protein
MTREEITAALRETIHRNGMEGSSGVHVRLMVTRGEKRPPRRTRVSCSAVPASSSSPSTRRRTPV